MRAYRQSTEEDRIEICAMKQAGKKQNQTATVFGVCPSTISRELTHHIDLRGIVLTRPNQRRYCDDGRPKRRSK